MAGWPLDNDGNRDLLGNRKEPKGGAKLAEDVHSRCPAQLYTTLRSNHHGVLRAFLAVLAVRANHSEQSKRILFPW